MVYIRGFQYEVRGPFVALGINWCAAEISENGAYADKSFVYMENVGKVLFLLITMFFTFIFNIIEVENVLLFVAEIRQKNIFKTKKI